MSGSRDMRPLVLDTNIVLDLFVFADTAAAPLREFLRGGTPRWLATSSMRDELQRVLAYPHIATRMQFHGLHADGVLAAFDAHAQQVPEPTKCAATCTDPDDQKFIDLAIAHAALLLSKDRAVLTMRRRLQRLGAEVATAWRPEPTNA